MQKSIITSLIFSLLLLCGCGPKGGAVSDGAVCDTLQFSYSKLIRVEQRQGYRLVTIANPWKAGKTLHQYALVPKDAEQEVLARRQQECPQATLVRTPLRRSVVFTTVHCALLTTLDCQSSIAGVADLKYIKVPWIQEQCREGKIMDCGDGMSPVIEKIIDSDADAILLSPFENSGGYGRLEEIDIPLIECAEYMEPNPLARAEWMRFYGLLYGCEEKADSLFAVVDSCYNALKDLARQSKTRRSVIVDKQTGSVWYVPGGKSTIGQMLGDAVCNYPFADDDHSGSLSMPFEAVLEKGADCEVWLFRYDSDKPITMKEFLAEKEGYSQFRAVKEKQLYGCNVSTSLFYEESPFRPDLLLSDFISILHPDMTNLPEPRYYFKVAD